MKKLVCLAALLLCSCVSVPPHYDGNSEVDAGNSEVDAGTRNVCCNCNAYGQVCGDTNEGMCRNFTCYHWCVLPNGGMSYAIESCSNPCVRVGLETWVQEKP